MAGRLLNTHSQDASECNFAAFARILRVNILISLRLIYLNKGGTPNKPKLARCERVRAKRHQQHFSCFQINKKLCFKTKKPMSSLGANVSVLASASVRLCCLFTSVRLYLLQVV